MIQKIDTALLQERLIIILKNKKNIFLLPQAEQTIYISYFYVKLLGKNTFTPAKIRETFLLSSMPPPGNIFDTFSKLKQKKIFISAAPGEYMINGKLLSELDVEFAGIEFRLFEQSGASNSTKQLFDSLGVHPKIREVAESRFAKGDYSVGVDKAFKRIIKLIQAKSQSMEDGSKLVEKVFSPNAPILAFNNLITQSEKDEQTGMMFLFKGAIMGVRNVRFHEEIEHDEEKSALHLILLASFLTTRLEESFMYASLKTLK